MAGRLFPLIALLLVTILYAHGLSLEEYGTFQSVWMYANLASVVMGYGLGTIIFSTHTGTLILFVQNNRKYILGFYAVLWVVCVATFFLVTSFSPLLKIWIAIFIFFQNINSITETWLIKNNGENAYFRINLFYSLIFFGWHYYILQNGYDLEKLIAGIVLLSLVKLILLLIFRKKNTPVPVENPDEEKLLPHWIFAGINDVLGIFTKWIDKLVLVYILLPSEFAIFFNGSIEIPLFSIFIGMTGSYMMMQMSKEPGDQRQLTSIFKENFLLLSSIVFPLFFFLLFFRYELFMVFFGEKYLASVPVFLITILILPFRINHFGGVLQVFAKSNLVTLGSLIDLIVAITLIFVLYPIYGMQGAASALVISTIIQIIFYMRHTSTLLNASTKEMIPANSLIIRFVVSGFTFFVLWYLIRETAPMVSIVCGLILFFILSFAMGRKFIIEAIRQKT